MKSPVEGSDPRVARAKALTSALEAALDRVGALEAEYAHTVQWVLVRDPSARRLLEDVDAAREHACRLLLAWAKNPELERRAVIAHDDLANTMRRVMAMARGAEEA